MSQKLPQMPEKIEVQRILGTEATTRESNTEKRKVEAAFGRSEVSPQLFTISFIRGSLTTW